MAIFHLHVKTIGRSAGRSATAAAAYRAGTRMTDERTGVVHDYSRKRGVEHTQIFLPDNAPDWATDRARLWNAAELAETRKNSTVAREFEVALPSELDRAQRLALVREFAGDLVREHGMAVDVSVHQPGKAGDTRNHHAHILCSTRRLTGAGFKDKTRELDDRKSGAVATWRQRWADLSNRHFEAAGRAERIDHRSLVAQRAQALARGDLEAAAQLDRPPTVHLGPKGTHMQRRGMTTERGRLKRTPNQETGSRPAPAAEVAASHLGVGAGAAPNPATASGHRADIAEARDTVAAPVQGVPGRPTADDERTTGKRIRHGLDQRHSRKAAATLPWPGREFRRVAKKITQLGEPIPGRAGAPRRLAAKAREKLKAGIGKRRPALRRASRDLPMLLKGLTLPDDVKKLFAARLMAGARERHRVEQRARRKRVTQFTHQRSQRSMAKRAERPALPENAETLQERSNLARSDATVPSRDPVRSSEVDQAEAARRSRILERFRAKAARDRAEERERGR